MAPLTPYLAEELWQKLGFKGFVHQQTWPVYDPKLTLDEKITIVVQINGKVREKFKLDSGEAQEDKIKQLALSSAKVQNYLKGASYRTIFVPCKLINFIVNTK